MAAVPAQPAHCCCSAARSRSGWRPRLALHAKRIHIAAGYEALRNSSASAPHTSQRLDKFSNSDTHNSFAASANKTARGCAKPSDAQSLRQESPAKYAGDSAMALGQVVQLMSVERLAEARLLCEAVVRRDRTSAQAQFLLGVLCTSQGDHSVAEACYRQACALDPNHAAAHINLGQTLSLRGAAEEAVYHLRTAVQLAPAQFEAHLNLAVALRLAEQPQHARVAAHDALRLSPSSAAASILLGEIEIEIGETADALAHARRAVALVQLLGQAHTSTRIVSHNSPDEPHVHVASSSSPLTQAQTPSQLSAPPATRAAAHTLLGAALSASGDFGGALHAYAAALEAVPAHAAAHAGRARVAAPALRSQLSPKRGDVFIATFPKSGTTWMQKIVCMLLGEPASVDVQRRAPWAEGAVASGALSLAELNALSPPRIFKTHAAWPALPVAGCRHACIPSGIRVICVVRDPRDVMVSLYHHSRAIKAISWTGSWDGWFDAFLNGRAPLPGASPPPEAHASDYDGGGDWFAHTRSWWTAAQRFPEQVLWISYESLHADMPAAVRRLGAFLRRSQDDVEARLREIMHECSFGVMKMQHESGPGRLGAALRNQNEAAHFRRGAAGGWRAYFTEAQREIFASSWRDRAAGIGITLDAA